MAMLKVPTVFVIGAGAGVDVGMAQSALPASADHQGLTAPWVTRHSRTSWPEG